LKAITVEPGTANSVRLEERPEPPPDPASLLVQMVELGVCGTDREIVAGSYGWAPPGNKRLVLGHESLGRVLEAPDTSDFSPGDLVVGIVRRPDPVLARPARPANGTCAATACIPNAYQGGRRLRRRTLPARTDYAVKVLPARGVGRALEPASVLPRRGTISSASVGGPRAGDRKAC
jgi:threonine dehydrogenase-like Zn-dependent dehydrogenase